MAGGAGTNIPKVHGVRILACSADPLVICSSFPAIPPHQESLPSPRFLTPSAQRLSNRRSYRESPLLLCHTAMHGPSLSISQARTHLANGRERCHSLITWGPVR